MKTANALVVSTVALMITLSASLARGNPENGDAPVPATAYAIGRPGDAAASCNALVAEIDQISTEVQLRSIAQANPARSRVAHADCCTWRPC